MKKYFSYLHKGFRLRPNDLIFRTYWHDPTGKNQENSNKGTKNKKGWLIDGLRERERERERERD